jgi:hypothetical protein
MKEMSAFFSLRHSTCIDSFLFVVSGQLIWSIGDKMLDFFLLIATKHRLPRFVLDEVGAPFGMNASF